MRYINQQDALKALGDCIKPGTKRTKDAISPNPCAHTVMRRGYINKKREELKEAIQPSPYLKKERDTTLPH